jgi:hypothetical protein
MRKTSSASLLVFRILVIGITLLGGFRTWNSLTCAETQEVTIASNKAEYEQGETITITIKNASDRSIWYLDYPQDLQVWGLEKFKNNAWIDVEYTDEAFWLPVRKSGKELCYLILRERPVGKVAELKTNSGFSFDWDQKICRTKTAPEKPFEPRLLEKGRYRFIFSYGLSTKKNMKTEPWNREIDLAEVNVIHSGEFTIK